MPVTLSPQSNTLGTRPTPAGAGTTPAAAPTAAPATSSTFVSDNADAFVIDVDGSAPLLSTTPVAAEPVATSGPSFRPHMRPNLDAEIGTTAANDPEFESPVAADAGGLVVVDVDADVTFYDADDDILAIDSGDEGAFLDVASAEDDEIAATVDGLIQDLTVDIATGVGDTSPIPAGYERAPSLSMVATGHGKLMDGMAGRSVREVQALLNENGVRVALDGKYGPSTAAAVRRFQRRRRLSVDGRVGKNTLAALRAGAGVDVTVTTQNVPSTGHGGSNGRRALDHARGEVGVRERSGRNDGVPAQRYSGGRREPWCANFVAWTFRQAGHPLPGNQRSLASVQYMEDQLQARGAWSSRRNAQPQPGDIIFFRNRGGSDRGSGRHVGIVERVANGKVYTIEGNSGNSVRRREYALGNSRIAGYGRW